LSRIFSLSLILPLSLSISLLLHIYSIIGIYVCPVASDLPCPGESIALQRDWFSTLTIVTFLSLAVWWMSLPLAGANSEMNFRFGNIGNICSVFSVYRVHIEPNNNIKYYNIPTYTWCCQPAVLPLFTTLYNLNVLSGITIQSIWRIDTIGITLSSKAGTWQY